MAKTNGNGEKVKSMESWIWDAACSIRGVADAAKFKDYILPKEHGMWSENCLIKSGSSLPIFFVM